MTTRRPDETAPERDLGEILRSLPRQAADEGFTARVLAGLDTEAERRSRARPGLGGGPPRLTGWLVGGLATAALALVLAAALVGPGRSAPGRPESNRPETVTPRVAEIAVPETALAPSEAAAATAPVRSPSPGAEVIARGPAVRPPAQQVAAVPSSGPSRAAVRRAQLAEARSALEALRRDHRRLTAGLVELPEIGADGQPVLYVGGDEGLGLVLGPRRARGEVRPAAYPGGGASL